MNSERALLNAMAVLQEAQNKQRAILQDADSLQTRAKFRYISAQSREQKRMDAFRAQSFNDILEQFGDLGVALLDPENPMRGQLYAVSDALNRPK